jgi:hypothetical protein
MGRGFETHIALHFTFYFSLDNFSQFTLISIREFPSTLRSAIPDYAHNGGVAGGRFCYVREARWRRRRQRGSLKKGGHSFLWRILLVAGNLTLYQGTRVRFSDALPMRGYPLVAGDLVFTQATGVRFAVPLPKFEE